MSRRVAVAMSGGVDSSVAAALLKDAGYDVIGLTMVLQDAPQQGDDTFQPEHVRDAERVARQLAIPYHVVNYAALFQKHVVHPFVREYCAGRTPNPCVHCNRLVKFGLLLDEALSRGADFLATGHYARIEEDEPGLFALKRGTCLSKDQSYFLFALGQRELSKVLLPLGTLNKDEVRAQARHYCLEVSNKEESQEICFVPGDDYVRFLEESAGVKSLSGSIVDRNGIALGRHNGIHRYTVGQRRGLGIGYSHPLYVLSVNPATQDVVVGSREELGSFGLTANDVTWHIPPTESQFSAVCKIRYRHEPTPCSISILDNQRVMVRFNRLERAVTPGQAVVFYRGDVVLGGGWIERGLGANEDDDSAAGRAISR